VISNDPAEWRRPVPRTSAVAAQVHRELKEQFLVRLGFPICESLNSKFFGPIVSPGNLLLGVEPLEEMVKNALRRGTVELSFPASVSFDHRRKRIWV
jgi:hypothetical protein